MVALSGLFRGFTRCRSVVASSLAKKDAAGRVFPFSASTLARKRADLVEKANVTWLKDGFRHTFASAHMAKHGDATKTMLALGQKDLKMIWRHYYRHMTAEETEKFWAMMPK
jgi:integrase